MTGLFCTVCCTVFATVLFLTPSVAFAQQSKTTALAAEVAGLLDQKKLTSIATRGSDPDHFVGVQIFVESGGRRLNVIAAKPPVPQRIAALIDAKVHREAFRILLDESDRKTKMFISDSGADGLQFRPAEPPALTAPLAHRATLDRVEVGGIGFVFDGDWQTAKISEDEYREKFQTTEEEYMQILQLLLMELKKS